jgi:hypothetical protein
MRRRQKLAKHCHYPFGDAEDQFDQFDGVETSKLIFHERERERGAIRGY